MPFPDIQPIPTTRLRVRPLAAADLDDLMAVNGDPEVTRFLPYTAWSAPADAQAWLERMKAMQEVGTGCQLVISLSETDKAVGTILLFRYDEQSARVELGYALAKEYWGQGIAYEAARALLNTAFRKLSIRRVEAEVQPENLASSALLIRLGFVREGLLRERWIDHGAPSSVNVFGLLKSDWASGEAR